MKMTLNDIVKKVSSLNGTGKNYIDQLLRDGEIDEEEAALIEVRAKCQKMIDQLSYMEKRSLEC
jgi:hypothetical protein